MMEDTETYDPTEVQVDKNSASQGPSQRDHAVCQELSQTKTAKPFHSSQKSQSGRNSQMSQEKSKSCENIKSPSSQKVENSQGSGKKASLARETSEEVREWLTSRPTFSDQVFQQRNPNTYSVTRARKMAARVTPQKSLTQDQGQNGRTENQTGTDPYTFHGSQSQRRNGRTENQTGTDPYTFHGSQSQEGAHLQACPVIQ